MPTMKRIVLLTTAFLFGCVETESQGEYEFEDGRIWIDVVTNQGAGSQKEEARTLFRLRAKTLCGDKGYVESDIKELSHPSRVVPTGPLTEYTVQSGITAGFIKCNEALNESDKNT